MGRRKLEYNTFSDDVRASVYIKQDGKCYRPGCDRPIDDFHHVMPNTQVNRQKYGDERVQSEENCRGCCRPDHIDHVFWDKDEKRELKNKWDAEIQNN